MASAIRAENEPRAHRLPLDGQWHTIDVQPMLIDWSGKPYPRSPRGKVRVKALDDDNFQRAHDAEGWIYIRYEGGGWGWTTHDCHVSTILALAFASLAGLWPPKADPERDPPYPYF